MWRKALFYQVSAFAPFQTLLLISPPCYYYNAHSSEMPKEAAKVDEYEEFVRQSSGSSWNSQNSGSEDSSPPSSPESVYPEDAEIMLDLTWHHTCERGRLVGSSLSPYCSPRIVRRRDSSDSVDSSGVVGHLSEASLERHTRMFESRERMGRCPHPSYRFELYEQRRSMTPSPRHRPIGLSYSVNSPLPVRTAFARRPTVLELQRSRKLGTSSTGSEPEEPTTTYKVRSFATSSKGFINRGDSVRVLHDSASDTNGPSSAGNMRHRDSGTPSLHSQDSNNSDCSMADLPPVYKVVLVGANNVGKTSLTQQFMTSEYVGHMDSADEHNRSVNVVLDSEEATLRFTTLSQEEDYLWCDDVDAYVIVYSVSDLASRQRAAKILEDIRHDLSRQTPIILVANKADIVRNRVVSDSEGKRLAHKYDCKYIAVSALLNHKVDELLAGVLSQIRLSEKRSNKNKSFSSDPYDPAWLLHRAARGITRALRKHPWHFRSCDNLLVL